MDTFKRFLNWVKALFNRGMDKIEDPEMMLDQAKRDMQKVLVENKERAIQAIKQKNRLQLMMEEEVKKNNKLQQQAEAALKSGDRDLATTIMREKLNSDNTMTTLKTSLDTAINTVEQVKVGIKNQEEEVRKRTSEALVLKAQWKTAQVQNSISKALDGLNFDQAFGDNSAFSDASEKIRLAQSEAAARQEMQGSSLSGKMIQFEDKARDLEAEDELSKLEERLGLKSGQSAVPGSAEAELDELEKQLKGQVPGTPDITTISVKNGIGDREQPRSV